MVASRKAEWLAAALAVMLAPAVADFKAAEVRPKFAPAALALGGRLELDLTPNVEEALAKGIPLEVIFTVRLYRERKLLWDRRIAEWTFKRELRYHALSGQYLIGSGLPHPGDAPEETVTESFNSLPEALRQMGALDELKLPLPGTAAPAGVHTVEIRAYLDIEALPAPLRPVAYTSLAWRLNSGWSTWKVQR